MNLASRAQSLFVDVNRKGNFVRGLWDRLSPVPGGKAIFSRLVGQAAPYTGSMRAHVVELGRGHARVELPDRRRVRNHLDCVHAIALTNLAELTGNAAMAYSLPDDARFIVAGLSIEYKKKARGTITGVCQCPIPTSSEKTTYEVEVSLQNRSGEEVALARLQTLVGPKR